MLHMLWVGVLAGMIISALGPGWLRAITFLAALAFSGLLVKGPAHHLHIGIPMWLIAIGGVAFGLWSWHYARLRGLQHLGAAELRNRWANVRGVSKWGW